MPTHFIGADDQVRSLNLYIKLMRATQSVAEYLSKPLSRAGVTPSQFGVLETLYHLGSLPPSVLAAKHLMSRNNVTVVIDNIVRNEWATRERSAKDRRVILICLSDTGRQKIEELLPVFVDAVQNRLRVLSASEQDDLAKLLKRVGLFDVFDRR